MTREEEINKQADIYIGHSQDVGEDIGITKMRNAFIESAKWADTTMIEKACEWMREEFYTSKDRDSHNILISASWDNVEELIEDFKKQWRNNYGKRRNC